jgi:hypothetical protein
VPGAMIEPQFLHWDMEFLQGTLDRTPVLIRFTMTTKSKIQLWQVGITIIKRR